VHHEAVEVHQEVEEGNHEVVVNHEEEDSHEEVVNHEEEGNHEEVANNQDLTVGPCEDL